jgi:hypothetical protein
MTQNISQKIPAATIPVEELAAEMEITPNNLRLAIELVAAAGYTVDLGLGIHVKVEILDDFDDDSDDCDDPIIELARLRVAAGCMYGCPIPLQMVRKRLRCMAGFSDVSRLRFGMMNRSLV